MSSIRRFVYDRNGDDSCELSEKGLLRFKELAGYDYIAGETLLDDIYLIQVIEEMGTEANGNDSELCIKTVDEKETVSVIYEFPSSNIMGVNSTVQELYEKYSGKKYSKYVSRYDIHLVRAVENLGATNAASLFKKYVDYIPKTHDGITNIITNEPGDFDVPDTYDDELEEYIVDNADPPYFILSQRAMNIYNDIRGTKFECIEGHVLYDDRTLIRVIKHIGEKASSGNGSDLRIINVNYRDEIGIVYNSKYTNIELSEEAKELYIHLHCVNKDLIKTDDIPRDDRYLVLVVQKLGPIMSTSHGSGFLRICYIPRSKRDYWEIMNINDADAVSIPLEDVEEIKYTHDNSWNWFFDSKRRRQIIKIMEECHKKSEELELPIYPPKELIFRVFQLNVHYIKVVLIGQDPYHGEGQANGLAFSVNKGVKTPPSLNNIFKEINNEFSTHRTYDFPHGDLTRWHTEEGIFLLNASLTVLKGKPSIFMKLWEEFTNDVIRYICKHNDRCAFLLLGNFAKEKMKIINDDNRCICGVHPSPLSANRGFLNSTIFRDLESWIGRKIHWAVDE